MREGSLKHGQHGDRPLLVGETVDSECMNVGKCSRFVVVCFEVSNNLKVKRISNTLYTWIFLVGDCLLSTMG